MKKVVISALLLIAGLFVFGTLVKAATCEMKSICIDNTHVGLQGPDCKIIPADEFFDAFPGAKGTNTYVCNIGCTGGECIKDNIPETCSDTDGGTDYFIKGMVTLKQDGATATSVDYCSDNNTLIERTCGKGFDGQTSIVENKYECPNGCVNGACVKTVSGDTGSKCTDTDGGKDIYRVGVITVNGVKIKNTDSCSEVLRPQYINEYFCLADGTYSVEEMKCPGLCEMGMNLTGDYCTKTCAKTAGYYCTYNEEGSLGVAYLTKDCVWEKYAPCQSHSCGIDACLSYGAQIDTDGDGLLDVNEENWGTDPNNVDTDGDGYNDMTEIYGGYNPLGSGKLTMQQLALLPAMEAALDAVDFLGNDGASSTVEELSSSSAIMSEDAGDLTPEINGFGNANISSIFRGFLPYLTTVLPVVILLVVLLIYVYTSLCLQLIAKKLNIARPWLAWIPIANLFLLIKCAGKSYWWFLLLLIPLVNLIASIIIFIEIIKRLGYSGWLVILMFIGPINLIVIGYLAFSANKSQMVYSEDHQGVSPDSFSPQIRV